MGVKKGVKSIKLYDDNETYIEHILRDKMIEMWVEFFGDGKKCHCDHLEELENKLNNKLKEHDKQIENLIVNQVSLSKALRDLEP